jgi:hypothetical protein
VADEVGSVEVSRLVAARRPEEGERDRDGGSESRRLHDLARGQAA